MPGFGLEREQDLVFQGVYRIPAGGGDLQLLVDDFAQPNGLCFSPDESLLYINDTDRAHIRVFDVGPDGIALERARAGRRDRHGRPDDRRARRRDEARRARQHLRHRARRASGSLGARASTLGVIEVPENVGNLNWGGDDWQHALHPRLDLGLPHPARGRRQPARLHALTTTRGGRRWMQIDPQRARPDHPGPAERRDHRGRRLRRLRRARPRHEPERRREREGPRRGVPQGRRPGDPRLVHRRGGRARPQAERAALQRRQGRERARPRQLGRGAGRRARAAGRRPRRREDAHERLPRHASSTPSCAASAPTR